MRIFGENDHASSFHPQYRVSYWGIVGAQSLFVELKNYLRLAYFVCVFKYCGSDLFEEVWKQFLRC